jgi:hypothetical protein
MGDLREEASSAFLIGDSGGIGIRRDRVHDRQAYPARLLWRDRFRKKSQGPSVDNLGHFCFYSGLGTVVQDARKPRRRLVEQAAHLDERLPMSTVIDAGIPAIARRAFDDFGKFRPRDRSLFDVLVYSFRK